MIPGVVADVWVVVVVGFVVLDVGVEGFYAIVLVGSDDTSMYDGAAVVVRRVVQDRFALVCKDVGEP